MPDSPEVTDAILSTKISTIERDIGDLRSSVADLSRLATEMRIFMAESRATAVARDKADLELQGKLAKIEKRVDLLESFKWRILIAIASAGALGGGLSELVSLLS